MDSSSVVTVIIILILSLWTCFNDFEVCGGRVSQKIEVLSSPATFNVLDYGAKGDGLADDTKAFQAAWAAACRVEAPTLVVPSDSAFLVKPVTFSASNCKPNIVFQLDGKIIAPTSSKSWGSGLLHWLNFSELQRFTINGKGIIDGQGAVWWKKNSQTYNPADESLSNITQYTIQRNLEKMPKTRPTALRFYKSHGVTVTGITIQNSPKTHLKFDDCTNVRVFDFNVSSPGYSPNTDGIHLQNSQGVVIYNATIACGDDCISIQTGCSGIYAHNVTCGPGHGISIGGLGPRNTKACVSNITVQDITLQNTLTGVRIKTWQGGFGSVKGIEFSNIRVSQVHTPIVIDQYYCEKGRCSNQTSAVAVSGINYVNIQGTYTKEPVHLACSDSLPCKGLSLEAIELNPFQESQHLSGPFCWKAYGEIKTDTVPPIDCLNEDKPPSTNDQSKNDSCLTRSVPQKTMFHRLDKLSSS